MESKEFGIPVRVYIEDTDAGGIVFYANYLKYFERARTELIRSLRYSLRAGLNNGLSYVVHSIELKYHMPALLDDEIQVSARLSKLGKTYMIFDQQAHRGSSLLVSAKVKIACVSYPGLKPRALDSELGSRLKQYLQE